MNNVIICGSITSMPVLLPGNIQMVMEVETEENDEQQRMKILIWRGVGDIINEKYQAGIKAAIKGKLVNRNEEVYVQAERVSLISVAKENVVQ